MTRFEARMLKVRNLFDKLKVTGDETFYDLLEDVIMNARTVTFIMKKELTHKAGFEDWYESKKLDFQKFKQFIEFRNTIEKEGKTIIRSEQFTFNFSADGPETVGTATHSDGSKVDIKGKMTRKYFFGKPGEEHTEVMKNLEEYISFLETLVKEVKEKFGD